MPRKDWGKGTDLLNAVQEVVIRGHTTEESLEFLKSRGFKISESKLRKIKKYHRESINVRLDYIANHEYAAAYIDAIDAVKSVISRLWEIVKESKGTSGELKALEQISNNIKTLVELYDSTPIIALLSKKLAQRLDNVL